jgi:hypothetical protein
MCYLVTVCVQADNTLEVWLTYINFFMWACNLFLSVQQTAYLNDTQKVDYSNK